MENMKSIIGSNIHFLRKQRGWTLQKLSNQIGISYQQLSRIENGLGTSSTTLERIAIILGVEVSTLMASPENNLEKDKNSIPQPLLNKMQKILYNEIVKSSNNAVIDYFISNFSMMQQETDWIQEMIFRHIGKKENYHFTEEELLSFIKKLLTEFVFHLVSLPKINFEEKEEEEQ